MAASSALTASLGVGNLWQDADRLGVSDADGTVVAATVALAQPVGLSASATALIGWQDAALSRSTQVGDVAETLDGKIDGDYKLLSAELSYGLGSEELGFGPMIGISHIDLDYDEVAETGGVTALTIDDLGRVVTFGRVGGRAHAEFGGSGTVEASAAYRRAWGDRVGTASVAFDGNTQSAAITAMPIAREAVELGVDAGVAVGRATITLGYAATLSKSFDSHGGRIGLSFSF